MKAKQWVRIIILATLLAGLLFFILKYYKSIVQAMLPLGIGVIIAYILLPLVDYLTTLKISRPASILISFILSTIIILLVLLWLIPILTDNIKDLAAVIPKIFNDALEKLMLFIEKNFPDHWQQEFIKELDNSFKKIQDKVTQAIYQFISTLPKTLSLVFDVLVAWILSFYILKDKELIVRNLKFFFPKTCRDEMVCFFRDIHLVVLRFIQGQVLIAIIIAAIEMFGLYLIGMPYAPLLGFFGGISNIIPYFGPYFGAVPALAVALTISPWKALWTAAVFIIVQQIDNVYLSPRIMKGKLGLHPVTTMMAVIAGGRLFGFFGLLFGVPAVAMLKVIIKRVLRKIAG